MDSLLTRSDTEGRDKAKQMAVGNGNLKTLHANNGGATTVFLLLFDAAAPVANGTVPSWAPMILPPGERESDTRRSFKLGLYVAASSTEDTLTLIETDDVWLTGEVDQ